MKKIFGIIFVLLVLVSISTLSAQKANSESEFEVNPIKTRLQEGYIQREIDASVITKYKDNARNVIISSIIYGIPVLKIGGRLRIVKV